MVSLKYARDALAPGPSKPRKGQGAPVATPGSASLLSPPTTMPTTTRQPAPDVALSDAVSAFNKAVSTIVNNAQEQARVDVSEAATEARQMRRERDDALKSLSASKKQEATWKQEATNWKSALEKAELKIKHGEETITELRADASRWKEQCFRLEETSLSWKEQFLRVEAERARLATRVEQLMLAYPGATATPYHTPRIPHVEEILTASGSISASALGSTNRNRRPTVVNEPVGVSSPPESGPPKRGTMDKAKSGSTPAAKKKLSRAPRLSRPQVDTLGQLPTPTSEYHSSGSNLGAPTARNDHHEEEEEEEVNETLARIEDGEPRRRSTTTVIRRVHAIVEVPVKEEEPDESGYGVEGLDRDQDGEEDELEIPILPPTSAGTSVSHLSRSWKAGPPKAIPGGTTASASAGPSSSKGWAQGQSQSQKTATKASKSTAGKGVGTSAKLTASASKFKPRKFAPTATTSASGDGTNTSITARPSTSSSARKAAPKRLYVEIDSDTEGEDEQQASSGDEYREGSEEDELNMRADPRPDRRTTYPLHQAARSRNPVSASVSTAASASVRSAGPAKKAKTSSSTSTSAAASRRKTLPAKSSLS